MSEAENMQIKRPWTSQRHDEHDHSPNASCNPDKPFRQVLVTSNGKIRTYTNKANSLKIVTTHLPVKPISPHALQTSVCKVLTGIIVLACGLAEHVEHTLLAWGAI